MAQHAVRAGHFQVPVDGDAAGALHVQVQMDVRVGPLDLGNSAGEDQEFGSVVLSGGRMVRTQRSGCERDECSETGNGFDHG